MRGTYSYSRRLTMGATFYRTSRLGYSVQPSIARVVGGLYAFTLDGGPSKGAGRQEQEHDSSRVCLTDFRYYRGKYGAGARVVRRPRCDYLFLRTSYQEMRGLFSSQLGFSISLVNEADGRCGLVTLVSRRVYRHTRPVEAHLNYKVMLIDVGRCPRVLVFFLFYFSF